MHRFSLKAALTLALVFAPAAAYADTIKNTFTVSGPSTARQNDQSYAISSTYFSQFNTSLGTLNYISYSLQGTATSADTNPGHYDSLKDVAPSNLTGENLNTTATGSGNTGQPFMFTASGMDDDSYDLSFFEGTGTEGLALEFGLMTVNVNATGTLTYNYTPAAPIAVTPEPSSFALLGTGILGVVRVVRKRLA